MIRAALWSRNGGRIADDETTEVDRSNYNKMTRLLSTYCTICSSKYVSKTPFVAIGSIMGRLLSGKYGTVLMHFSSMLTTVIKSRSFFLIYGFGLAAYGHL